MPPRTWSSDPHRNPAPPKAFARSRNRADRMIGQRAGIFKPPVIVSTVAAAHHRQDFIGFCSSPFRIAQCPASSLLFLAALRQAPPTAPSAGAPTPRPETAIFAGGYWSVNRLEDVPGAVSATASLAWSPTLLPVSGEGTGYVSPRIVRSGANQLWRFGPPLPTIYLDRSRAALRPRRELSDRRLRAQFRLGARQAEKADANASFMAGW